jgi:Transposase DDE domain
MAVSIITPTINLPRPAICPAGRSGRSSRRSEWPFVSTRGDQETYDVRYYLSSLPLDVKLFATSVRAHWSIENTLHWCLDVTLREDDSRVRERNLTNNLAWLKRFAISLLKQVPDKRSVAMRRRVCGWNENYLTQVLFGSHR